MLAELALLGSIHFSKSKIKPKPQVQSSRSVAPNPYGQLTLKAPGPRFVDSTPLPGAGSIVLDQFLDGSSIASSIARNRNIQERMLWIDGTANLDQINTQPKILALMQKVKDTGFNTVVLDVKPICGYTLYPSQYAQQLTEWRGQTMPQGFDPLAVMCQAAKADGLSLIVSLNAFSEGHNEPPPDVNGGKPMGPGFLTPDEQTTLYEPKITLKSPLGPTFPTMSRVNVMPADASEIGVFTDQSKLPTLPIQGAFAVTLAPGHRVVDGFENGGLGSNVPTIPDGGALLIGIGTAADFLRQNSLPGQRLDYEVAPHLVLSGTRPKREIPLMMNPNDPRVQAHIFDIVREIATKYPVNGIMFDDRLRYAGLDGDFSDLTRQQFEKFVGHSVHWPASVYRYTVTTDFKRGISPGQNWDAYMSFRALTIRNFLASVRQIIQSINPKIELGAYTGSWYGAYSTWGSNWAAPGFQGGFWDLTPSYSQAGFARLLDFLVTGCYYHMSTVHAAMAEDVSPGYSVEAAGALTNRVVRDQCWTVGGISAQFFQSNPSGLGAVMSAACATTQGVMVFDLSYLNDDLWAALKRAFLVNKLAFSSDPQALKIVREQKQAMYAHGDRARPVIILPGSGNVGQ